MSTVALVDCNNFYASCEKLFRPDLRDRPVVVLSNNDGCVIARSREAKTLGIKMGTPLFQIEHLIRRHGIETFSSNYALYGDLSARVVQTLEALSPRVEQYSIDECFVDMAGVESAMSLTAFGHQLKATVLQHTGIHVCVGIAPTKTLAKLANHAAKQYPATGGVVDLTAKPRQLRLLKLMPVDEVWGVGRRLSKQLDGLGIKTAYELATAHPAMIRKQFSVVLERTVRELNGIACIAFEDAPATKQQILCSRSFGTRITELHAMRQAICAYATRAAEKLRAEAQLAQALTLFIRTSPFNRDEPQYAKSATQRFEVPSDDTRNLTETALSLLVAIWRDGYRYQKAGIMLTDFVDRGVYQPGLFDPVSQRPKSQELMTVLDQINGSGHGRVFFAGQGTQQAWAMKRGKLSPAYTTRWADLPRVR
ncbi:MAG: translesion error-prone DNA polymerase V subunit UmuC [Oceanospirillales bacterium]|nr:translesion error-prone DNA polymerase V subunit UmuC [Oceanospirillales bacterium]